MIYPCLQINDSYYQVEPVEIGIDYTTTTDATCIMTVYMQDGKMTFAELSQKEYAIAMIKQEPFF